MQRIRYFSFGRKNVWKVIGVLDIYWLHELYDAENDFWVISSIN